MIEIDLPNIVEQDELKEITMKNPDRQHIVRMTKGIIFDLVIPSNVISLILVDVTGSIVLEDYDDTTYPLDITINTGKTFSIISNEIIFSLPSLRLDDYMTLLYRGEDREKASRVMYGNLPGYYSPDLENVKYINKMYFLKEEEDDSITHRNIMVRLHGYRGEITFENPKLGMSYTSKEYTVFKGSREHGMYYMPNVSSYGSLEDRGIEDFKDMLIAHERQLSIEAFR